MINILEFFIFWEFPLFPVTRTDLSQPTHPFQPVSYWKYILDLTHTLNEDKDVHFENQTEKGESYKDEIYEKEITEETEKLVKDEEIIEGEHGKEEYLIENEEKEEERKLKQEKVEEEEDFEFVQMPKEEDEFVKMESKKEEEIEEKKEESKEIIGNF